MLRRDLELKPGALWYSPINHLAEPDNEELKFAVGNFRSNFSRVHAFATLLSNVVLPSILIERAASQKRSELDKYTIHISDKSYNDMVGEYVNSALHSPSLNGALDAQGNAAPEYLDLLETTYKNIQYASDRSPITLAAMDAWLFAQVTGAWTSFEVLAADLWIASVNKCPIQLGRIPDEEPKGKKNEDKTIPLWMLAQHNFDLSNSMGELLKTKQNFSKLSGIVAAYKSSFQHDGATILKTVGHESLFILSQVRNIILHNGGRFDANYLQKVEGIPAAPRGAIQGNLALTGTKIYNLLFPVAEQSRALIEAVDAWLSRNGDKR